jgi:hypothetical protein
MVRDAHEDPSNSRNGATTKHALYCPVAVLYTAKGIWMYPISTVDDKPVMSIDICGTLQRSTFVEYLSRAMSIGGSTRMCVHRAPSID